ncbi:MAG: N,N-dimethylformamidase beta subunit family domain-containing protein, partial [Chitinophagaceae bacterium]
MTWRSTCNFQKVFIFFITALILSFSSIGQNAIVTENALPGNPSSEWSVPDFRDNRIAGFSTKMSLNAGETVRFKINVQGGANYTLKIYRLGYYGGNGARLKHDFGTLTGTIQPAGISDPSTGILDCGNWSQSASWAIPASAVSGLYVAKMEKSGGGSNHIVFIVRNDASQSDLYLQFPDARWQAYNGYGGNSTYDGTTSWPSGHAVKASYNRPMFPYNSAFNTDGRGADWYMNNEFAMLRWLERNGYDVTYTGSNHIARNGALLLNHKVFLSIGHDEYWSKGQRDNVEAARNAGVHLAFFSGNEVYWKTRWENNDGSEDRTLVVYKEGLMGDGSQGERACGFKCDASTSEWTGLWRTGGNYDAGKPENALTGQISWYEYPTSIAVPSGYKKIRFWRNTNVSNLSTGQTASLGINTLGYEWDYEQPQYASSYPQGRITMSSTTVNGKTHKLSLYRHSSGALVFGAGTIQWSWGLDTEHWGNPQVISPDMQQATINLFADMGVQAGSIQPGLVQTSKSSDFTAPTASIISPSTGSTLSSGATIPITGTATDAGGGVVASVEVSVDGGASWSAATINAADGNVTWSYSWQAGSNGTINIKARGVDDSGNIGNAGAGITVTVGADVTPPTVLSVSPTNGSTGVSINTTVTANFSESVNGSTVTGTTFQLKAGSTVIPATVNTASNQITLTPTSALANSTT